MQAQKTERKKQADGALPTAAPDDDDKPAVKSIDRAATILQVLATFGIDGAPLTEVARLSGFGKATTHRLLAALSEVGFASQKASTRHYHLGARLALLSRQASQLDIAALAKPSLEHLASVTEDTSYVSVREGMRSLCLGREQGAFPIKTLSLDVGLSRPLGVGSGSLAMLAFLAKAEIELAIESNRRWLLDFPAFTPARLETLIRQTQAQGFAFIEGLIIPGVNAVGVPIFDDQKQPVAALSITAIADRVHGERTLMLASLLRAEADEVGAVMKRQLALRPTGSAS